MKKTIALLLAVLLMLLTGCSGDGTAAGSSTGAHTEASSTEAAEPVTTAPETVSVTETTAPATTVPVTEAPTEIPTEASTEAPTEPVGERIDPWSLMGELLFEQGSYVDEFENEDTYSYSLPILKADTPDAAAINQEIDEDFGSNVREAKQAMEAHQSLALFSVGYYGEVWQDVLTVVLISHWNSGFDQYGVYAYDVAAGRRLDTPALLEKMGVSQDDFLEACRTQFRRYFEEQYNGLPEDRREDYGYNAALERVDGPEFVNLDLMAYPDANGDIVVIAPIVSLAGADYYYHPIHLGLNGAN